MLSVSIREAEGGVAVVEAKGEIDMYTAQRLREVLRGALEKVNKVVVDLSEVRFIDSTGLGVLIGGLRRAREKGGDLVLASPSERVKRILEITNLTQVLPSFDQVEEAILALKEGGEEG